MLGGILEWIFRYIFGAVFELDFSPLFGQNFARDLLVLRDFLDFESGFRPVLGPLFDRTFHRDFCHRGVRVSRGRACQSEVPVFEVLFFIDGVLHVSRGL